MDAMLRQIGSRQFTEWMAYYRGWPPEELMDYRFGVLAAGQYNTAQGNKKKFTPDDFFPSRRPKDHEDMLEKVRAMNQRMGGQDVRGRDGRDQSER